MDALRKNKDQLQPGKAFQKKCIFHVFGMDDINRTSKVKRNLWEIKICYLCLYGWISKVQLSKFADICNGQLKMFFLK